MTVRSEIVRRMARVLMVLARDFLHTLVAVPMLVEVAGFMTRMVVM
jgi:hypothetical protein